MKTVNPTDTAVQNFLSGASITFDVKLIGETKREDWVCDQWAVTFKSTKKGRLRRRRLWCLHGRHGRSAGQKRRSTDRLAPHQRLHTLTADPQRQRNCDGGRFGRAWARHAPGAAIAA